MTLTQQERQLAKEGRYEELGRLIRGCFTEAELRSMGYDGEWEDFEEIGRQVANCDPVGNHHGRNQ